MMKVFRLADRQVPRHGYAQPQKPMWLANESSATRRHADIQSIRRLKYEDGISQYLLLGRLSWHLWSIADMAIDLES